MRDIVPVLEIGGTHVTAAVVDTGRPAIVHQYRGPLRAAGTADDIAADVAAAAGRLDVREPTDWGVAIPGPFDYDTGIGDFCGVDKFTALCGLDVGALFRAAIPAMTTCHFLNDADAFALGEVVDGAARGTVRSLFLTLGTGVGSAFVRDQVCIHEGDDVPSNGYAYLLTVDGRPLEQTFSRAALTEAYRRRAHRTIDVHEIADLARAEDGDAVAVVSHAYDRLAEALAPWISAFEAEVIVIGGSIAGSWDLVEGYFVPALGARGIQAPVRAAADPDRSPLIGTADHVRRRQAGSHAPTR